MPFVRRVFAWLLCLALAGQQAAALAAVPCDHATGGSAVVSAPMHAGHHSPAASVDKADPHAGHAMHASHATPASEPVVDHDGCECGCAMTACLQSTSSMLPAEWAFPHAGFVSDSPLATATRFDLDRDRASPLRPPIAA